MGRRSRRPALHRVVVLVRDGVLPMELGLAHQLFRSARSTDGCPLYEVVTCAPTPGTVRTDADFSVQVSRGLDAVAAADTLVVPASHETDESLAPGTLPADLVAALDSLRPRARVATICTGSFVLAAAGLLDGHRATTHWQSAELFASRFPAVQVDPDVLYTDDGSVLTSAGEAAGVDLCLHMIRRDHGAAVSNAVARRVVVPPHRDGGQAQYVRRPVPEPAVASTAAARSWALEHLDRSLSLHELAACASMSVRTFTRRFREEVGTSPGHWLTRQRLDQARQLLEETDLSIDRVAAASGLGTGASLRQHLRQDVGVSPTVYRRTFRGGT